MKIFPEMKDPNYNFILQCMQRPTDWLSDDIEHMPFGEIIFWARRINVEPLAVKSKYNFEAFIKEHPEVNKLDYREQFEAYAKWLDEQEPEGDLRTPFGRNVERWWQYPTVRTQFLTAYKTYGWYLVNKSKSIARKKRMGSMFTDTDWGHVFRCLAALLTLDYALYKMEEHNASAWEIDPKLAERWQWISLFWAFFKQEHVDITQFWSSYDKVQSRQPQMSEGWIWLDDWLDPANRPELLGGFYGDTITLPLDGSDFVTSL